MAPRGKRSFFERLTGSVSVDEYDDVFEDEEEEIVPVSRKRAAPRLSRTERPEEEAPRALDEYEDEGDGQLAVDVFQTPDDIVVKAHLAGVRPEDLDISITRDMVTIKGKREEAREVTDENYYYHELYWGSFSRTILLPQEVDTEAAEANEKHGLLTIRLPKIDKEKQMKLKVKGG